MVSYACEEDLRVRVVVDIDICLAKNISFALAIVATMVAVATTIGAVAIATMIATIEVSRRKDEGPARGIGVHNALRQLKGGSACRDELHIVLKAPSILVGFR
jgi:hypothetical protein